MITIVDVARAAGVSKTLVSRYLNGKKGVGAASARKIETAIATLGYRPNALARALVLQRTATLGVVVDDLAAPFVQPLIAGLEQGVRQLPGGAEYTLLYASCGGSAEKKQRQLDYFVQGRVDGVILFGSLQRDEARIRTIAQSGFPLVLIEADLPGVSRVRIDNEAGAFDTTQRLIKAGHRHIVHVAGNQALRITRARAAGYTRAMEQAGLTPRILHGDYAAAEHFAGPLGSAQVYYDNGYRHMQQQLAGGRLPDALFFASDLLALGALQALRDAGTARSRIPALAGFDDEAALFHRMGFAPITTRRQPLAQAGMAAVELLLERLQGELPPRTVDLTTEYVPRMGAAERNML